MERLRGVVKWFDDQKRYGVIRRDEAPDVFVDYTALEGLGYQNLRAGQKVEFEIVQSDKGARAASVKLLSS